MEYSEVVLGQNRLGTHVPIASVYMKGWLFQQSWLGKCPATQRHPLRWTSISKGQVWNSAPPQEQGRQAGKKIRENEMTNEQMHRSAKDHERTGRTEDDPCRDQLAFGAHRSGTWCRELWQPISGRGAGR